MLLNINHLFILLLSFTAGYATCYQKLTLPHACKLYTHLPMLSTQAETHVDQPTERDLHVKQNKKRKHTNRHIKTEFYNSLPSVQESSGFMLLFALTTRRYSKVPI